MTSAPSRMKLAAVTCALALTLAACGSVYVRSDEGAFSKVRTGQIPAKATMAFSACLMDGFGRLGYGPIPRQEMRPGLLRVENVNQLGQAAASVDIFDDGRTEFYKAEKPFPFTPKQELRVFDECLARLPA